MVRSIQLHAVSDRTRSGSVPSSHRYASTASIFSSTPSYILPSTHRRTSSNRRSTGFKLRTVGGLDDRRKAYIPHLLATVSTRPIPYQRFHIRVILQLLDRLSYIIGPHRVDPPPYQPPPPNI